MVIVLFVHSLCKEFRYYSSGNHVFAQPALPFNQTICFGVIVILLATVMPLTQPPTYHSINAERYISRQSLRERRRLTHSGAPTSTFAANTATSTAHSCRASSTFLRRLSLRKWLRCLLLGLEMISKIFLLVSLLTYPKQRLESTCAR